MMILQEIQKKWPPRALTSHKGHFGRVVIVAGSTGLTGAAHLASSAAVRMGAGLVSLAVPKAVYQILARREAEVMVHAFTATKAGSFSLKAERAFLRFSKTQDVLAVGPGLSRERSTQQFIRRILEKSHQPLVIDADGLNAMAEKPQFLKKIAKRAILTPHAGEFQRLFGGDLPISKSFRCRRAMDAARGGKVIIILKGAPTLVVSPEGQVYENTTGNPGMATGGTGDVLTGMIAALIAQKFSLWDAARFGVFMHGYAGDLAAKKYGQVSLKAGDLIDLLPLTLKKILKHESRQR